MCRSSIFNFESLEGFSPRKPAALLLAALMVFALELGVRLAPDTWLIPNFSRLGFRGFMEHVVLPKFDAPQIAVVGTSKGADAISPKALDEALGLPAFSSVNLSIFGGRTSDWLNLYERNRAKLSHCKLFIVVVDEWCFSSGVGNDDEFCLDAPFADRWNFVTAPEYRPDMSEDEKKYQAAKLERMQFKRNRLLADWAFQIRLKLGFLPAAVARSLHLGKKRDPLFDEYHMIRSTQAEVGKEGLNPLDFDERIRNFYKYFDAHPIFVRHIEDLARLIHEDGGRLLLLQLPNRSEHQREVERLFPSEFAQQLRVTDDLAKRVGASFFHYRFPEDIGLADNDYTDYCHMALSGTMKCTKWLAELIRKERLLAK